VDAPWESAGVSRITASYRLVVHHNPA
jgi:hypothetical protein